jgi:hypothetical protein
MHTFSYFDEDENEYEVNFDYDPYLFEEEDPSQSPWHYITILEVRNSNNEIVEFDDDKFDNDECESETFVSLFDKDNDDKRPSRSAKVEFLLFDEFLKLISFSTVLR